MTTESAQSCTSLRKHEQWSRINEVCITGISYRFLRHAGGGK
jgi:hypothetical protein